MSPDMTVSLRHLEANQMNKQTDFCHCFFVSTNFSHSFQNPFLEKKNKHWKKDLVDMHKRMEERANQPPPDPPMLFMVERIKRLKGCPYWEKDACAELGLDVVSMDLSHDARKGVFRVSD